MEQDRLDEVIKAAESKRILYPQRFEWTVSFVTEKTLTASDKRQFRDFQRRVEEDYFVRIPVVGGGWGCTKLTVNIDCDGNPEAGAQFLLALMRDRTILPESLEINAVRLHKPPVEVNLVTGKITNGDQLNDRVIIQLNNYNTRVSDVRGSQVVVGSRNVMQAQETPLADEPATKNAEKLETIRDQLQLHLSASDLLEPESEEVLSETDKLIKQLLKGADRDAIYDVDFTSFQRVVKAVKNRVREIMEINRRIRRVHRSMADEHSLAQAEQTSRRSKQERTQDKNL
jgi:hypothetical protein